MGGAVRADPAGLVRDAVEPAISRSSTSPPRSATVARRAAEGGGRPLVVVDNTFASPALQRPLHAGRRHRLPLGDEVPGRPLRHDPRAWPSTSDAAVAERLRFLQNAMGAVPGPLDCFLVLRGLRTLHLRMERHGANAAAVAAFLAGRADVAAVYYPAMGGMVSFVPGRRRPAHGRTAAERAVAIAEATRLFTLAELLGGVESLIEVPAAMTHMSVAGSPLEVDRRRWSASRSGIEDVDDLDRGPGAGARRGLTRARAAIVAASRRSAPTRARPASSRPSCRQPAMIATLAAMPSANGVTGSGPRASMPSWSISDGNGRPTGSKLIRPADARHGRLDRRDERPARRRPTPRRLKTWRRPTGSGWRR